MSKVRVAIIGCGGMGGAHASHLVHNDDAEIVAVCDVSRQCAQSLVDRHLAEYATEVKVFDDAELMYSTVKPDAVIIVTPHTLHFEHGLQALDAGCHVLMEKPMVTDSQQAHKLAERVRESGRILTVGYNTPCSPEFNYLRKLIRSRELGRLETVTGWQAQDWGKATSGTWRQKPELSGGGQMYDSGAHFFNSLVWSVEQPVTQVAAFVDNLGTPVDINGTVNIRFADGVMAVITISGNSNPDGAGMYFIFENGRVEIDGWGGAWIRVFKRGFGQVEDLPLEGKRKAPSDNFIDSILGRDEPRTTVVNGIIQSELMDAIYQSARTGSIVTVRHVD